MTYTPMINQYLKIKENYQDSILLFRLGDFYEMFFDDAIIASKILDLVLTKKSAGKNNKIPMCGFPHFTLDNYLYKLVESGQKVAVAQQMEEASPNKMVHREVTNVVTPGTLIKEEDNNEIINICSIYDYQYGYSLVILNILSGELTYTNIDKSDSILYSTLLKYNVKEVVLLLKQEEPIKKTIVPDILISYSNQQDLDRKYDYIYEDIKDIRVINSLKILINYLIRNQKHNLSHIMKLKNSNIKYMNLDYNTLKHLELIKPLSNNNNTTLFSFLDQCQTYMGSRLLKKLIENPLYDIDAINKRLDQVTYIKDNLILQENLKNNLSKLYDIEKIVAKSSLNTITPIDMLKLKKSLYHIPLIFNDLKSNIIFNDTIQEDTCSSLYNILESSINEEVSNNLKESNIFKEGYDQQLDQLKELTKTNKTWIIQQETIEKEKTGIKNLKIGYNRVFGYYIEITKNQQNKILDEFGYIKKQTLTNQERYITNEIKEKEDLILNANDKINKREQYLLEILKEKIKEYHQTLQSIAYKISYIDNLYAFSIISNYKGYTRPNFNQKDIIIKKGKHPILANIMKDKYISNDCILDNNKDILLLTGPNMGGKSTYKRQIALNIIMAQMGLYTNCEYCSIPLFDGIYTRIGASDDILSGDSTFMVEMKEANLAISNATKNSLIVFDEIGRGTSTYDGLAIANAIVLYISKNIKCKTLFSTHYQKLTELENTLDNLLNYQVSVVENDNEIIFLYKVIEGKSDKSYGINVAKLANLPEEIIQNATNYLNTLEKENIPSIISNTKQSFTNNPKNNKIIEKLKLIDPNNISPIEALILINELKRDIKDE